MYGGDSNFTGSTSSAVSQTVNTASSSTTLASATNPSTYGGSVTFTATVTTGATGTVTFNPDISPEILGAPWRDGLTLYRVVV